VTVNRRGVKLVSFGSESDYGNQRARDATSAWPCDHVLDRPTAGF